MLQVLTEDLDNGKVLAATYAATHPISVRLNRNNYYWKSLALLPRILRRFRDAGPEAVEVGALAANHPPRFYSRRLYTRPTNRAFVAPLARHIARRTRRTLVDRLWWDQWILLFDMRDDLSTSPWRFTPIIPPRDRFWADPHIVYRDGTYYVFIEEYLYAQRKGRIAVLEMDESGRHGSPRVALETPFHLSYPHLFTWEDQLYMVPESGDHGRIDVYRCQDFPFGWMHDTTLLRDHLAVDATLFEGHDRWWLFTNIQERPGASPSEELFLFHAPSPLSQKWRPHPMNPVVSDARSSRPAGRLFVRDGVVYRPSQDCSRGYGYGLRLNRIVTLTPNEYREEEVTRIEPRWHRRITGVHSLAHEGRLTMIDAKRRRSRLSGQGR